MPVLQSAAGLVPVLAGEKETGPHERWHMRQRGFIDGRMFTALMWFFLIVGLGVGAILFVVIPWLWRLLKPWIHTVTG